MAKLLIPGIVVVACLAAGYTGATFAQKAPTNSTQTVKAPEVQLFQSPSHHSAHQSVPGTDTFVAILQKGEWLKVGDKRTGDVGWINTKDFHRSAMAYRQALATRAKQNVSSYSVYEQMNKQSGQPEIVAYRDGKRLSGKEAQTLYHQSRKAEQAEFMALHRQVQQMQAQMNQMMQNSAFSTSFGPGFAPAHEIVLLRSASQENGPAHR